METFFWVIPSVRNWPGWERLFFEMSPEDDVPTLKRITSGFTRT